MPTSDEQLDKLRQDVENKRQALANSIAQRETRERETANDIVAAQLLAESARLDKEIENEAKLSDPAIVEAATGTLIENALGGGTPAAEVVEVVENDGKPELDPVPASVENTENTENAEGDAPTADSLKKGWGRN